MGILVSAAEAGALVERHERIIRRRIKQGDLPNARKGPRGAWQIDVDDLAAIWTVDRERLAQLEGKQRRSPAGVLAQVEILKAEVRQLRGQVERLHQLIMSATGADASDASELTPTAAQEVAWDDVAATILPVSVSRPPDGLTWRADDAVSRSTTDAYPPTYPPRRASPTLRLSSSLPDELVSMAAFTAQHGVPETTVKKAIQTGRLPAREGAWKHGRAIVRWALDADGRRAFFALWGDRDDFRRCPACPH